MGPTCQLMLTRRGVCTPPPPSTHGAGVEKNYRSNFFVFFHDHVTEKKMSMVAIFLARHIFFVRPARRGPQRASKLTPFCQKQTSLTTPTHRLQQYESFEKSHGLFELPSPPHTRVYTPSVRSHLSSMLVLLTPLTRHTQRFFTRLCLPLAPHSTCTIQPHQSRRLSEVD